MYKSGEKFRKGDGCNECVCMPGGKAQCTNKPCYPGEYVHNSDVLFFSNVENYTKSRIQSVVIVFVGVFFLGGGGSVGDNCFENPTLGISTFALLILHIIANYWSKVEGFNWTGFTQIQIILFHVAFLIIILIVHLVVLLLFQCKIVL